MKRIETPWPERVLVVEEAGGLEQPGITESFTQDELEIARGFRLPKRRDEWILSRYVAKRLIVASGIAPDPRRCRIERPWIVVDGARTEWRVSVSHSATYAGAVVGRDRVGIDVQVVRSIADSASHLFLSANETEVMQRCALAHRLLHFWCAKEAAWKQRSDEFATMKQLPLALVSERADGLLFENVETIAIGELIVAVTLPIS